MPRRPLVRASWVIGGLLALAVAGCLTNDDGGAAPRTASGPTGFSLPPRPSTAPLPPGCSANRTAVAHVPGAVIVASEVGTLPVPCVSKTGSVSREPTIGITAKGTVFHYPAMVGDNTKPSGVAVSTDRGATWKRVLPNVAGQPTHLVSTDPYLFVDPVTSRVFADDLNVPNCSMFSWSDDEGATWSHSYSGCMETDHQTIFTGRPVTSTTQGYPNIVYRCAINAVALAGASTMSTCQRSLDGGRIWLPPGQPAFVTPTGKLPTICDGALGHGASDGKGSIYLPKGQCGEPLLAISDDEGMTWRRTTVARNGIRGHEAGVGVDPRGNIYYTWVASDGLPYLSVSRDKGATWSAPLMVAAPGVTHAVFPELIVGGEGKIAFVYMGRQPDTSPTTYEAFLAVSYDALSDAPTIFSATVNDPATDAFRVGNCCGGIQDFIDVRIGPDGTPWGAFVDDCLGPGTQCQEAQEVLDTHREGAAGWFWGAPSLWDPEDPNGWYPGTT
ncbi:MAG: exo-alpha-sialidase [Euryarchaeota archaeon]|nr:exo-alpha-sialidase [Euryarchaeota archaeon]